MITFYVKGNVGVMSDDSRSDSENVTHTLPRLKQHDSH